MNVKAFSDYMFPLDQPVNYYYVEELRILVDTGINPQNNNIEYIYLTHWHWDHVMGIASFTNKKICANSKTLDLLMNKKYSDRFRDILLAGGIRLSSIEIEFIEKMDKRYKKVVDGLSRNKTYTLEECPHIQDGVIRLINCPGHSIDHVCYIINKYIFVGDTIIPNRRTTIIDFAAHRESILKIMGHEWKTLYPGHGNALNRDETLTLAKQYVVNRCNRAYQILSYLAKQDNYIGLDKLMAEIYGVRPSLASFVILRTLIGYLKELEAAGVVRIDRSVSPWKITMI